MRTTTLLTSGLLLASSVLAACGGDSDESTTTQPAAESAAASTPAAAATDTTDAEPVVTEAPASTAGWAAATQPAATAGAADAGVTECPDAAEIGPLYGAEVELDEAAAMTGAIGLVFCPYVEVVAPGTTSAFGLEPIPDEFSLTFTNQNVVMSDGSEEEVAGVGEAASWNEFTGLSVWTGERGLIVSITFEPPAGDAKSVAIAIAQQVLA